MSLHRYLTRLVLLGMLPLLLLAGFLAVESVRGQRAHMSLEATHLVRNAATAFDLNLTARVRALSILAASPLADHPAHWETLYGEAQGYLEGFGSHVIFASLGRQMLFNTRAPFGSPLPMLPQSKGRPPAEIAAETLQAVISNILVGPVAKEPLVAITVPGVRQGRAAFFVISTIELRQFQERIDRIALPGDWSLTLLDGNGIAIARRAPAGLDPDTDVDPEGRFVVHSEAAPWSLVLEIPRRAFRAPLVEAGIALAIAVVGAALIGIFGGMVASRRLGRSVASLVEQPEAGALAAAINEIAAARALLDRSAEQRMAAEERLRESEQRFRATFEQAAVGMAVVAPDGRWLRVNRKLCDIVGYSREELLARSFQDITHPDDLDADLSLVAKVLAGEIETYSIEKRYLRKGGAIVWVNLTVALARHADGSPDHFISVVEDIERRKQAEAALLEQEAALRAAQRLARVGNWSWDLRSNRHYWSEDIFSIYGRDPKLPPAAYPEVQSYFTPESWARLAAQVEDGLAHGNAYECDAEVVRSDGTHRWITVRGEARRDAAGNVVDLRGTVQDITERRQAAEALRELNAELERRVEQRTAELTAANRELESFAYSVSHDLRAPLRSMDGFAQAIEEDYAAELDDEGRDALGRVRAAARHMGNLINDLLTLSSHTRAEMNLEAVDLAALAGPIVDELRRAEPGRDVRITLPRALDAHGDRRLLAIVLANLLGNAWKYTGRRAHAHIELGSIEHNGLRTYFVRDDGAGFDMAGAAKLFTPFERLHDNREFPGTGIGLATVQRIVQRHGGRVWAEAAVNRGATFYFTLPA
jgi:PAS domain S-box-containing protein